MNDNARRLTVILSNFVLYDALYTDQGIIQYTQIGRNPPDFRFYPKLSTPKVLQCAAWRVICIPSRRSAAEEVATWLDAQGIDWRTVKVIQNDNRRDSNEERTSKPPKLADILKRQGE
jgi:hypothetical protein